jgi:hypothetical protein
MRRAGRRGAMCRIKIVGRRVRAHGRYDARMDKRRVYLWSLAGPVIVVPGATGILYCNQTDGVATVHRELEGWLLPISETKSDVFDADWWYRHYNRRREGDDGEWQDVCRRIESALRASAGPPSPVQVEVVPHPDNCEAWVHVAFAFIDLGPNGQGHAMTRMQGVLTWQNCD